MITYQVDERSLVLAFLIDVEVAIEHMEGMLCYLFTVSQYYMEAPIKK